MQIFKEGLSSAWSVWSTHLFSVSEGLLSITISHAQVNDNLIRYADNADASESFSCVHHNG